MAIYHKFINRQKTDMINVLIDGWMDGLVGIYTMTDR